MTLTRDHGDFVLECDGVGCNTTLATNTSNFDAAMNVVRRNHWKAQKLTSQGGGGDSAQPWRHSCPDCQAGLFSSKVERKSA